MPIENQRTADLSSFSDSHAVNKRVSILREAKWLAAGVAFIYLILVFSTFSKLDPGWTHSSVVKNYINWGGPVGAWVADVLYFLFGISTWWLCVLFGQFVWTSFPKHAHFVNSQENEVSFRGKHYLLTRAVGFLLLLGGSSGIEFVRFYSLHVQLPRAPGGVFGQLIGGSASHYLGFTGGTLFLLLIAGIGFSLFFEASWLSIVEKIGEYVELTGKSLRNIFSSLVDYYIGRIASKKREESSYERQLEYIETVEVNRVGPSIQSEVLTQNSIALSDITLLSQSTTVVQQDDQFTDSELLNAASSKEPIFISEPAKPLAKSTRAIKEKINTILPSLGTSTRPRLSLLDVAPPVQETVTAEVLEATSRLIESKLSDFGVKVTVVAAHPGPVVTRYEIDPAVGVKGSQIVNLARDLARALSVTSIRVVETIPGKNYMGLELPNPKRQIVRLTEILGSKVYEDNPSVLTVALGKDISGNAVVADLAKMPHLLVAGTTGSGKSVGINATILSLLFKADADDVRLILIDPKMLELSIYEGIPHLLAPVVTDMKQAAHALNWAVSEMERRYKLMSKMGVRNLAGYNAKIAEADQSEKHIPNPFSLTPDDPEPLLKLPTIVIVIDELADLMMVVGKKVEELIARIAQKARAAGIHLILATQRPSVDVITGLIKANIPTRIAFQVSSKIDSRTILDQMGAEALLGMGDMLYLPPGSGMPLRVHGAFVSDEEVHRVVDFLKEQGDPDYIDGILDGGVDELGNEHSLSGESGDAEMDDLYDKAVEIVLKNKRASISLVQRHLRIGYNRAARILEQMEHSGIVSTMQSNGNREILVPTGKD